MLNSATKVGLFCVLAFGAGVYALSACGGGFLRQMSMCDTTVGYLDLARQASDRGDYVTADNMYKQALNYARQNDPTGQAENAMLLTYAKFAYEKKHDKALFVALQSRARELRARIASQTGAAVR